MKSTWEITNEEIGKAKNGIDMDAWKIPVSA
jgi:hypothetical protein